MAKKRAPHVVDAAEIRANAAGTPQYTFANILNSLMEEKGIDQEKMASDLGISTGAIHNYRHGKTEPKLSAIIQIADYLGVDCHYLLTGIKAENATTAKEIGLSEKAIENLNAEKENHPKIDVINYLIEEKDLLRVITNYLSVFALTALSQKPYRYIPLKKGAIYPYMRDIYFSATIRCLQKTSEKFETTKKDNDDFVQQTVDTFLFKFADIDACHRRIKDEDYFEFLRDENGNFMIYEDTPDLDDEIYDDEDINYEIEFQQKEEEKFAAIMNFLDKFERHNK